MEINKREVDVVLETAQKATETVLSELADLQLAWIGGGVGEVVLS